MDEDEFDAEGIDLDEMDEEFNVVSIAAQRHNSSKDPASAPPLLMPGFVGRTVVKTEMEEEMEPARSTAPPALMMARSGALARPPPPPLPTSMATAAPPVPFRVAAAAPSSSVVAPPPAPTPVPPPTSLSSSSLSSQAPRPVVLPAVARTQSQQKAMAAVVTTVAAASAAATTTTKPSTSSVSTVSTPKTTVQTTLQMRSGSQAQPAARRSERAPMHNASIRVDPATPVAPGRVDSSLFTTPSSTLRKVDRNPAESPFKRTKVSEEDAAMMNLGSVRPELTPMGRTRIPGPAGDMLVQSTAKKKGGLYTIKNSQEERAKQSANSTPIMTRGMEAVVSPTDPAQDADFYHGPWLTMLERLQLPPFLPPEGNALRFRSCIEDIQRGGWRSKVPQLVAVIKAIATDNNASVTLKDPTGEIQGTIHHSALDNHPNLIKKGAVLILRQVSVFTPVPESHYLNITDSNVVHVFHKDLVLPKNLKPTWRHTYSALDAYQAKQNHALNRVARAGASNSGATSNIRGLAPPLRRAEATTPYATPKLPGSVQPQFSQAPVRASQQQQATQPGGRSRGAAMPPPSAPSFAQMHQRAAPAAQFSAHPQQRAGPPATAPQHALSDMDLIYAEIDEAELLGSQSSRNI